MFASVNSFKDTDLELPKRVYAEGLEPQVNKINSCCRMEVIRDLKKAMFAEYGDVKIDHVFKHIMAIAKISSRIHGKLVDSFLCTSKKVHNWTRRDRMRLIYLFVIMGVVMGRDEKVNIPHIYIKLVMDLDKLRKFHWGLHSYDFLLSSIEKARKKLVKKNSYIFEGFSYAFQIWIMEAILDFGEICGRRVTDSFRVPSCSNWKGVAKVSNEDIIQLENSFTEKGDLFSVISVTVIEPEETEMEEADIEDIKSEADKSVNDTDIAEDVGTSSVNVTGKGKRKIHDEGAKTRKKKLTQMANMESMFKERMGNMGSEVSQLREAISLSAEGSIPKSKTDEAPPKRKTIQAPAKKKGAGARLLEQGFWR
ncbi:hypothetical protein F2Q68_00014566 [Brassica cretica]|uniref:DUF1985 domain-containing protein n=1 Tax=Brassica cretica TaxID=69181 RepID=A0A8S9HVC6_BRACR|nr:hypothetical protein F2Q68_00014566 [Brassica cretica]